MTRLARSLTVTRLGAIAGSVLRGSGLNNQGLRLKVVQAQPRGNGGGIQGGFVILDVGDNYHIVMTGMERVNVELGQSVLAGEPVAVMGVTRLASIADVEHTSAQPLLYVEFRKDGNAIDSAPWWAPATDGEVNG